MRNKLKAAKLTGGSIAHPAGTLHEVLCVNPDCGCPQFHRQGTWQCILCSTPFRVQPIHLVETKRPVIVPETPPEANPALPHEAPSTDDGDNGNA